MSSLQYTCISCRVAFAGADLQRTHYKSDWHHYNLKRKVADMVPVTAEEFKQRVLEKQAQATEVRHVVSSLCKVCGKHFNTANAFTNHMQSKKHKDAEARAARQMEAEVEKQNAKNREKGINGKEESGVPAPSTDESGTATAKHNEKTRSREVDQAMEAGSSLNHEMSEDDKEWEDIEGEPITATQCLFCSHSSQSVEANCRHMMQTHSFFLPNIEYVCDLEGFLAYLGEKVGCGFMCLWCNKRGRSFYSLEAVQRHMIDKGHCKLQYEGDIIYEYAEYYDFRKSYPDHQEQSGGDGGSDDEDDDQVGPTLLQVQQDGYELVLPSGARVGHREFQRYFRQNNPPERQVLKRNSVAIGRIMMHYKALGWSGDKGAAAEKRIRDMRYLQKIRSRKDLHLSVGANKMQPHFRPQVIF